MDKLAKTIKILSDSCDGFYQDLLNKELEVLEYEPYEDEDEIRGIYEYEMFYVVATDRPSDDPYNEGKCIEMVWAGDTKVISYHDLQNA
ncbi:hypothetical protein ACDI16_02390 [Oceanobacillus caeni]|uniref:hypothetical protein n=1 Tax=Virgibacillus sp. SK37 TaxID=403957 RepID=UPI00119FA89C|nr:hypothetical protein [Virgibacillus sp. SK37]